MVNAIPKNDSLLLVIDLQDKFRNAIPDFDAVVENMSKLIRAFKILGIPIVFTEQYPEGLGSTDKRLKVLLDKCKIIEKVSFDAYRNTEFLNLMHTKYKKTENLFIAGIESHVCVFQTALSAKKEFKVHIVADAVSSRKQSDKKIALRRLEQEGIKIVSTEMVIFQMMKDSKDENFKVISGIVKS